MGANASKVEGEAGGQGVWEIVGSVQPTASKPEYISDRVLAFAYEDVRLGVPSLERVLASSANVQSASDGYIDCLVSAAAFLQEHHSGSYMIVNLGGLLLEPKLYSMFGNSCVEFVVPWNAPIGCGVCPLDILFATCSSIHNWLSMDDDHIAVLHTRTAPGGHADQFLRFVAACYLTYSLEFDHVSEALDVVMPDKAKGSAQQPRRRGSMGSLIRSPLSVTMNSPLKKKWLKGKPDSQDQRPSSRERASPSQRRYGQYFMNVLHSPVLPQWQRTPVLLRRIVLSFEPLGGTCGNQHFSVGTSATSGAGGEPVLVVHRRGQEIWAGVADTGDIQSKRDLVGFEPELLVVGDVVLSLWAGDRQRQHEMPIFSIPLNTAFVDRSVMRLTSRQVEQSANFPLPDDFFIDITFDDLDQRALDRHSSLPQDALMSLDEARHGWKSVLAATSGMSVTDFYAYEDVVHEIQARHATLSRGSSEGVERAQSDLREALKDIRAAQVDQEDGEGEGEGALDPEPTINANPAPPPPLPQAKQQPRPVAHKAAASLAALAVSPPPPPPPPPPSGGVPPPPPPPPRPGVPGAPPPPPPPGGALRGARKPYTGPKLRSWYWQAVNNVQGTVWSEIAAAPFVTGSRAESVRCRLVDLFPARAAGKQVKASGSASKAASLVKYIPLARANNISIMLTQFRGGGHEGLREAILGGRDFTLEQLGVLLQLIPTEEETRIMANVDPKGAPGLSEPEKFLLALSKIPRLRNKIQCRVFMSQFDTWAAEFREGLAANLEACRAARSSPLLRSVLGTSLAVGNLLHIGTSRHGAHGIRLESMLKMRDLRVTRGVKDATGRGARNLLDVVASEVAEGSGRRESLREELRAVHRATAYPQSDLLALMNQLEAGLAMVRAELEAGGGDPAWLADFEAKARRAKAECEEEAEGTLREAAEVVTFFGEGRNASSEEVFATLWSLAGQYDEALDRVPKNSK